MVLQRPPARPRIWGYADNVGDLIVVTLETGAQTLFDSAINGELNSEAIKNSIQQFLI